MSLKDNKCRITSIISLDIEREILRLASDERRTKSSMVALLLEEAIAHRNCEKEAEK